MLHRQLALALATWRAFTERSSGLRRRALARMTNALMVRIYEAWAEWTVDELEKTRKIRLLAARIQRGLEVRVLTSWHGYVQVAREALALALNS